MPDLPDIQSPVPATSDLVKAFIEHRDLLYGYVFAQCREHHAAEEVFQELGLAIVNEAGRGTVPARFLPWALRVARNRIIDHFRRQAVRRGSERSLELLGEAADTAFIEAAEAGAVAGGDSHERLRLLRDCLAGLGARARQLIEARYREELDNPAIAARLAWKESAVKVGLAKARRTLRECVLRKLRLQGSPS